ncbi:MAG: hypothetical protein LBD73_01590 [Deferribacteraceae bacterium]|jgi:peptidoglycan biosynthesis protein MviN/MurJ (putative lipid II flippase)|nr:hypothetical protein [Deferribacteraceae bacterium]
MKHLFRTAALISVITALILSGIFGITINLSAAVAVLLNTLVGLAFLVFLAKDTKRILWEPSPRKFYIIRFSLRFAAFAVWIYLMLVMLKFHFIPVLTGLVLPIFSFTATVFLDRKQ